MIRQDVSYIKTLPLEVQEAARKVFEQSLHHVFYFMLGTAICAVSFSFALLTKFLLLTPFIYS